MAHVKINICELKVGELQELAQRYNIDISDVKYKAEIQAKIIEHDSNRFENVTDRDRELEMERLKAQTADRQLATERTSGENYNKRKKKYDAKLQKYVEGEDIQMYIESFERIAENQNWDNDDKVGQLIGKLTGNAREAFVLMDKEDAKSFEKVKEAIFARYNLNNHAYRKKFRDHDKVDKDSFTEYGNQLCRNFDRWVMSENVTSFRELRELIILEQLIRRLPNDVRIWVQDRSPKSVKEATTLADQYTITRGNGRSQNNEKSQTKKKFNFRNFKSDASKSSTEKTEKSESSEVESRTPQKTRVQCFRCQEYGHKANECKNKKVEKSVNLCNVTKFPAMNHNYRVNDEEFSQHITTGYVNGKLVKILRDTGCNQTLVKSSIVENEEFISGEKVKISCVLGDCAELPVCEVQMNTKFGTGTVKVGVADTLPVEVLLGNDYISNIENRSVHSCMFVTRSQQKILDEIELQDKIESQVSDVKLTSIHDNSIPVDVEGSEIQANHENDTDVDIVLNNSVDNHVENVDMLVNHESEMSKLYKLQAEDNTLKNVRSKVIPEKEVQNERVAFFYRDKVLYRKWSPKPKSDRSEGDDAEKWSTVTQIVVPFEYRQRILKIGHDIPLAGHLGVNKTRDRILKNFYWPGIFGDISRFCRSCDSCQKTSKKIFKRDRAKLVKVPIVDVPFSKIAIDLIGPLIRTSKGNKYCLVIVDYATRWPEAIPIPSMDADIVADGLIDLFSRVGIPNEIMMDQGTNFQSKLVQQLCMKLHIKTLRSSPYHPMANGLVERFNQTLKSMLKCYVKDDDKEWDKILPYVLFAYREVPEASTGFSPFELLYGRKVRGPLDVLREDMIGSNETSENLVEYVQQVRSRLKDMSELAHSNISDAQNEQKRYYDLHSRDRTFEIGSRCLVLLPSESSKLMAEWKGPYKVIEKISPVDYKINMHDKRKKHVVFHVNMLRPYHERDDNPVLCVVLQNDENENNEDFDYRPMAGEQSWRDVHIADHLSENQKTQMKDVLCEFSDVFTDVPGKTTVIQHEVHLTSDIPVRQPCYRIPPKLKPLAKTEIDIMLKMGIVEESDSPYGAPALIIEKADKKSIRFCCDFRKINALTVFDAYPMPKAVEVMEEIGHSKYISVLDLTRGYWQVPLSEDAKRKSAFTTPFGLFQWTVTPFGMKNSGATFQRLVDKTLQGLDFARGFVDDLAIWTDSWESHVQCCRIVFQRLRDAGLTAKPVKCHIAETHVTYLGHIIGQGQVKPTSNKKEAILNYKRPVTKTDVRAFLGLVGFYRQYIRNFAQRSAVLTDLTKKNHPNVVNWTVECEDSFSDLKNTLMSESILWNPKFDIDFYLEVDACDRGLGVVLSQNFEDGDHPIAYASRKLLAREVVYPICEKECLAIVWGLEKFSHYFYGQEKILIFTDHNPLIWLQSVRDKNMRLMRWSLLLQDKGLVIKHRKGSQNGNADGLSRGR